MQVKIINTSGNPLPEHKTKGSAGIDLMASKTITVEPGESWKIPTGISLEIPQGYEVQIRPRSGLMSKGIVAGLGTIDSDYRGEISVVIFNHSYKPFTIEKGDRIAQAVLAKHETFEFIEVAELKSTERGQNGFGSTGI